MKRGSKTTEETQRVYRYAERYLHRSGHTEFPTVRKCARALRMRQHEIEEAVESTEHMFLSYYHTEHEAPLGDWFVETLGDRGGSE